MNRFGLEKGQSSDEIQVTQIQELYHQWTISDPELSLAMQSKWSAMNCSYSVVGRASFCSSSINAMLTRPSIDNQLMENANVFFSEIYWTNLTAYILTKRKALNGKEQRTCSLYVKTRTAVAAVGTYNSNVHPNADVTLQIHPKLVRIVCKETHINGI